MFLDVAHSSSQGANATAGSMSPDSCLSALLIMPIMADDLQLCVVSHSGRSTSNPAESQNPAVKTPAS